MKCIHHLMKFNENLIKLENNNELSDGINNKKSDMIHIIQNDIFLINNRILN